MRKNTQSGWMISVSEAELKKVIEEDGVDGYEDEVYTGRRPGWLKLLSDCLFDCIVSFFGFSYADSWEDSFIYIACYNIRVRPDIGPTYMCI